MRDTLPHHLEELSNDLWDALKGEGQLLRRQVALLGDALAAREEAAESVLQEALGEGEERALQPRRWQRSCPGSMRDAAEGQSVAKATTRGTSLSHIKGPPDCN